jgi:hypothetical protein
MFLSGRVLAAGDRYGEVSHRCYSFRQVGQGEFEQGSVRRGIDVEQPGQPKAAGIYASRQICWTPTLEDI